MEEKVQKNRFKGEYEVLDRYQSINNLAEALYSDNEINNKVAKDLIKIHHLRENIAYYLTDLLQWVRDEQILFVFATETLNDDISKNLGIDKISRTHENASLLPQSKKELSSLGYENLKKFLKSDYDSVEKILKIKNSSSVDVETLLK
ncbi:hypothetical protein GCM10007391_20950 [Alteromonas halophila]|uniref:Uncharacterized protein n=1 Tax=Alteromonas halophila TaxID=516698 RepID=A0A918JKS5_9ALTE|nr:hypothetical protein GCM10007391_20950 [Alteromonas halophila]